MAVTTGNDTLASFFLTSRNGALSVPQFGAFSSGVLSSDASYLSVSLRCYGGQDLSWSLNAMSLKTFAPSTGTNVIVPQPTQVLKNRQYTENNSIAPWKVHVPNDPNQAGSIPSPGKLQMCIGPSMRLGTIFQPGLPLLELQQSFRMRARLDVDIPNNAGTCSVALAMTNNNPSWQNNAISSSQGFDIDVTQASVSSYDTTEFLVQAWCSSTSVTICLTLSNAELTYNV